MKTEAISSLFGIAGKMTIAREEIFGIFPSVAKSLRPSHCINSFINVSLTKIF
jgi:hypothetical protein